MSDSSGHRLTTLPSGVRVVTEAVPGVRSAALGFFVATGSVTEPAEQAGWSHLLEHLLFRGTPRYGSAEIDELFDGMGAELNAGTGRESTSVYSRVLDQHLERAFDVMADMVWRPAITAADVASEQEIVLEELAMYEDDPQDRVFDLLGEATFGEHPLGRAVIGTRATVTAAASEPLHAFHDERYVAGDLVVAAAGSVDHDALVALVEQQDTGPDGAHAPAPPPPPDASAAPRRRFIEKPTEQVHLTLGAPGIARDDERRYALRVLDTVLGGTSSSRLFQEVREKRALAYSVSTFHAQYAGAGHVGLYLGTRPENLGTAMQVVGQELERFLHDGITAGRAGAGQGEREGARGADARVDVGADEPPRRRAARRPADPQPRRADRPRRGGQRRRRGRARARAAPARAPERRRSRTERDGVPLRAGTRDAGVGGRGMSAPIRVAVAGAAGRMGQTVCAAVEGAQDMELTGRADPALRTTVADVLPDADVVVDFTTPDTAQANALACLEAGVHVVIGTTGFDPGPLEAAAAASAGNVLIAPNFAIGAVLMMRFAAEAARHFPKAEIIELHHDRKLDAPSGTAARTASLMEPEMAGPVPIHSVRLPGLVAHQEVLFGGLDETLTIRHDSLSRESFMPGVLLAVRAVSTLPEPVVTGLEHVL